MEYGKRTKLHLTRAGLFETLFYVCYSCSAELLEDETLTHNCEVN